jgi:hypothetical protein
MDSVAIEQWQIIIGFFLPLLLSLIIQSGFSRPVQAILAFIVSLVVTSVTMLIRGDLDAFDATNYSAAVLSVFGFSIVFYQGWWKPTGIAPAIEERTSN